MRNSYEEQWGLAGPQAGTTKPNKANAGAQKDGAQKKDKTKRNSISSPSISSAPSTPVNTDAKNANTGLGIQTTPSGAPSQKSMTKAQRRAQQEAQKEQKAQRLQQGLPGNARKAALQVASTSGISPNPSFPGPEAERAISAAEKTPNAESMAQVRKRERATKENGLFAHLDPPLFANTASAPKGLHPAVINVGLQMAQFKICGANARCVATMSAFRKAIQDYQPPPNTTLSRHILTYLNPHINYLVSCRPMAVSMGNAIRYLKYEFGSNLELPDEDARALYLEKIDNFIRERITVADQVITGLGMQKIQDGDVILTYARSSVVQALLLAAHASGIKFKVIVVDSRPRFEGKQLLRALANAGVECVYVLLTAIGHVMKEVNKVILGAHSLLSNGALYSRAGTAVVAMSAHERKIPVIVCCETYKFSERVQLDSFVQNEIGNPDELVNDQNNNYGHSSLRHQDTLSSNHSTSTFAGGPTGDAVLSNWRDKRDLKLLNLLYDLTPSEFVTVVITEVGLIPCTSVPVILREYLPNVIQQQ